MLKIIGSANPRYLAATDLLIGDMSNINYEFLLFDRPIVLLANPWLKENFPDIGSKTQISNLENTISQSLQNPQEFSKLRKLWLNKTISTELESASKRYINLMISYSGLLDPEFVFLTGNNPVRKTNLKPLVNEVKSRGFKYQYAHHKWELNFKNEKNLILIAAHFIDLHASYPGFKIHIDHDLKGIASANLKYAIRDYKNHNYFPHIDLHIVTGEAGEKRTKLVLGPNSERTVIGGYPKGDDLLKYNTIETKDQVYDELGLKKGIPLVTYAPAGESSLMKPGGSLSKDVLSKLEAISRSEKFHVLIKLKYNKSLVFRLKSIIKSLNIFNNTISDDGLNWRLLQSELMNS